VLAQAIPTVPESVELMAYDFSTPQLVMGARACYMRNSLHDYPGAKCITILRNTVAAVGAESVVVIDEMILPNERAPWRAMQIDMVMMSCLESMERGEREWGDLLEKAGLRVLGVWRYGRETVDSVIMGGAEECFDARAGDEG
jgi:demethylsterigmatocystin 6-O-methyltransferase